MTLTTFIMAAAFLLQHPDAGARPDALLFDVRANCKQVNSCEEAVALWCNGYSRADGDGDGIPCENVCHSLDQVEEIKSRQGC